MNKKVQVIAITLIILFLFPFILPFLKNLFSEKGKGGFVAEYVKGTKSTTAPAFKKEGELSFWAKDNQQQIKSIAIEIADNEGERQQGLMYRTAMEDTQGMLFVFPTSEPQSFWMKNTLISLDLLFVNEAMEIVTIQKYAQPKSESSLPSGKPAKYVIEVNAGFCDRYGIKEGDTVKF
jgi:uncharacterized membrane protein (UPF0127 family)